MSSTTITSPVILNNDLLLDGASNPWECHQFSHQILHSEDGNFCSHVAWSISGDIPIAVTMDPGSGVISGHMDYFELQPSCTGNNYPKETITVDGANNMNSGRFIPEFYDFVITVKRDYLIKGPNPATGAMDCVAPLPESVSSTHIIKMIKNHDIDNFLYIHGYLNAGHIIDIELTKYDKNKVNELLAVHPGPFPPCAITV